MPKGWRTMTASEAMELALVAEKTSETTPQTVVAAQRSATTSHIPQGISFREFAGTKKMPKKAAALFIGVPEAQVATASKTAAATVDSPQFRAWFDGSKVVDENGQPLRVYHGTRSSVDFEEFSTEGPPMDEGGEYPVSSGSGADPTAYVGAHFAVQPEVASQFAMGQGWTRTRYEGEEEKPRVIAVYLRITNPKDFGNEHNLRNYIYQGVISDDQVLEIAMQADDIDPWGEDEESEKQAQEWDNKYNNDTGFREETNRYLLERHRPEEDEEDMLVSAAQDLAMTAKSKLMTAGYDGIHYKNVVEGGTAYIAFEPNQIKSAWASQYNPQMAEFTASKTAAGLPTYEQFVKDSLNYNWEGKQHTAPMSSLLAELEYQDEAELKPAFEKMRAQLSAIKTPVTVYRKVYLENGIKDLRLTRIGGSWSDDEAHAQIVHGPVRAFNNENVWTLKASVPESSIDWQQTIWLRLTKAFGEKEREIRVQVGAPVTLLGYKKEGGEWEGKAQAVTAAGAAPARAKNKNKLSDIRFEFGEANGEWGFSAWAPEDWRLSPVGGVAVHVTDEVDGTVVPWIFDIGVDDDWRGTGLGQKLYDLVIAEAKKRGYDRLLSSYVQEPAAVKAWGRLKQRYPVTRLKTKKGEPYFSMKLAAVEKPPYTYVSVGGSNRKRQHYVEGFNPNLHTEGMGGIPTSGEMERISGPYKTVREAAIAAKAYSEQTGIPTDQYVEFHASNETTPLKVADPPDIIETFRHMRPFERDRLIEEAPLKEVSPFELKTSQSAVSRHKVQWFMDNPEEIAKPRTDIGLSDTEQPYPLVLETNDGLWLYDGNHRSAAAYKLDLMIEAKVVDLRDYEESKTASAEPDGSLILSDEDTPNRSTDVGVFLKDAEGKTWGHLFAVNDDGWLRPGDVVIDPLYRNQGWGKAMYLRLLDVAERKALKGIMSGWGVSTSAGRVWKSLGAEINPETGVAVIKTAKVAKQYGPVYHGTYREWSDKIQIDQYKIGKFFSSDPLVAQAYGSFVYECHLTMNKPFVVDAKGSGYSSIPTPKKLKGWTDIDHVDTDIIAKYAYENGYDGAIIKNVHELHHQSLADDYIVFKPNQVKMRGIVEPEISPYTANKYHKQELQRRWERDHPEYAEEKTSSVEEDVADAKDWAQRNHCQIEGNRARMWHGTPNETAPILLKEGLRAGSKIATEAEEALFFAKRDRRRADGRLMTAKDITVLEVWLPFDSFYGTTWANLTRAVTPEETDMKIVKPIMKRAMAGWVGPVYHGTDKKFDQFEQRPGTRYILFKEFQVEAGGFFFTDEVEEAKKFGKNIMTCYLKMRKPLVKQEDQYSLSKKQAQDLTYICEPMMNEGYQDLQGNSVKMIELGAFAIDVDPDGAWLNEVVKPNGLDWNILDNQEVVNRMKERGYDSTMVDEGDGQYSYFVVSPNQIKINQTKTAAKYWLGERWAYTPEYGVISSAAEEPHTSLIEKNWGKPMSFGEKYDQTVRGYAFMDRKAKTIKVQLFGTYSQWVPEEVIEHYEKRYPQFSVEQARAVHASFIVDAAGPVKLDGDMYKNFKLKLEHTWHECGDEVEEGDWNAVTVVAFDTTQKGLTEDGKFAGDVDFVVQDGHLRSAHTGVEPEYRRQGLATAMYAFAEQEVGMKAVPHSDQTDEGRALWQQKDRPFGMSWASKTATDDDLIPKTKYDKVCHAIATDDKLWDYFCGYVQVADEFENNPEASGRVVELVKSIPPFIPPTSRKCLYRGEEIRMGDDRLPAVWEPHLRDLLSWSAAYDTAKGFAGGRGIVWMTVGKIQGIALEDIVHWRNWTHPNESNYSGMQSEWFVMNTCKAKEAPWGGKAASVDEDELEATYNAKYPVAGPVVDGREVIDNVDNMSSIAATFYRYLILDDIREVDFAELYENGTKIDRNPRSVALAEEIKQSGKIMPLIIGVDRTGPFVVEGSHRYDALAMLGAKSIPAVVVLDLDELDPVTKTAMAKLLYHGTSNEAAAQKILREGIQPQKDESPRSMLSPAKGRTYLSPSIGYAAIYALGGDAFGSEEGVNHLVKGADPYGYIFQVPSSSLNQAVPDEDSIGEYMGRFLNGELKEPWAVVNNLSAIQRYLTPNQKAKVKAGEYASWAQVGKKLQKYITPECAQWMFDSGAHVANLGGIMPTKAWRFKKLDARNISSSDASADILSICKEIPLIASKTAAAKLYHVSEAKDEQSIRQGGINPLLSKERWNPSDKGFYAFTEYADALSYAMNTVAQNTSSKALIWEVRPTKKTTHDESFFVDNAPEEWIDDEGQPFHSSVFHRAPYRSRT